MPLKSLTDEEWEWFQEYVENVDHESSKETIGVAFYSKELIYEKNCMFTVCVCGHKRERTPCEHCGYQERFLPPKRVYKDELHREGPFFLYSE
jgi:hypothetical protein